MKIGFCMDWRRLVPIALSLMAIASSSDATEHVGICQLTNVQIISGTKEDARSVCAGASAAMEFFTAQGVQLREPVTIEIMERLPDTTPITVAGTYRKEHRQIFIVSFHKFRQFKTWFQMPINREIYRSLAAHEVAHAIAQDNFAIDHPSIQAQEYLAYVTLFATMPSQLRQNIMKAIPGEGFRDEQQISLLAYMFDPMLFGVQSYRHYLQQEDGPLFFRSVLGGGVLRE